MAANFKTGHRREKNESVEVDSAGQTAVATHIVTGDCKSRQRLSVSLVSHQVLLYNYAQCNVTVQDTVMNLLRLYIVGDVTDWH
jgi:hypothetical protein